MKNPAPIDACENITSSSDVGGGQPPRSQSTPSFVPSSAGVTAVASENELDAALPGKGVPQNEQRLDEDDAVDIRKASAPPKHPLLFGEDATLPVFTSREEEIEFASQPVEEIVAAEADVLGLTEEMASVKVGHDLEAALGQLEAELAVIPDAQKAAYVEATRRCPEIVDEEHKKAFLWRAEYDATLAATRLAKYWEHRRALFGEEKCYLPFTLAGAFKDDGVALRHCVLRVVPNKDEKGRGIFLWDFDSFSDVTFCSEDSMLRACWYTLHVASRDPTVQESGFVILFRPTSSFCDKVLLDRQLYYTHANLMKAAFELESDFLPIVFRGLHWCGAKQLFHLSGPVIKHIMGKRLRTRFKVHYGSDEEVLQKLEEYGLPRDHLPSEIGGDVVIRHHEWLADRLAEACGTEGASAITAVSLGIETFASPVRIEGNGEAWEPIRIGGKVTPLPHGQVENSNNAVQSNQDATLRLEDLETTSSATRKLHRQMHLCEPQGESAKHKSVTTPYTGLVSNERLIAENILSNEPIVVSSTGSGANQTLIVDNVMPNGDSEERISGCKGDPRMNRAVKAKLENPDLSAEDALRVGGFVFPNISPFMTDKVVLDAANVSLAQRKNQFRRRLKTERKKMQSVT